MLRKLARNAAEIAAKLFLVASGAFVLAWESPTFAESAGAAMARIQRTSDPVWVGYRKYMSMLLSGEMGFSVTTNEPVVETIAQAAPWTVLIVSVGVGLSFAVGIVVGSLQAYREGSWFDTGTTGVATILLAVPFWLLGLLLVYVFAYQIKILPPFGTNSVTAEGGVTLAFVVSVAKHAVLPVTAFVATGWAQQALIMRGNSVRVLGEDYVRVARLRGISSGRIAGRYVGRNSLLPMYTSFVVFISSRLGTVVVLEYVFRYKGLGWFMLRALGRNDIPLLVGIFLVFAAVLVVGVHLVDATYDLIDPRVDAAARAH